MMFTPVAYAAEIRQEQPTEFLVTFPDVPEAITQGSTLNEACANAYDALAAAIEGYLEIGRELPAARFEARPMAETGPWSVDVAVEPKLAARSRLVGAMKAGGVNNVRLAQLMGRDEKSVRLILSGRGASLEKTLEALHALGFRPALAV